MGVRHGAEPDLPYLLSPCGRRFSDELLSMRMFSDQPGLESRRRSTTAGLCRGGLSKKAVSGLSSGRTMT